MITLLSVVLYSITQCKINHKAVITLNFESVTYDADKLLGLQHTPEKKKYSYPAEPVRE